MLQLILYADYRTSLGKADPEEFCQLGNHEYGLVIPSAFHHPRNGVQGVIQKVGINLALQRIQLTFPSFILFLDAPLHERFYFFIGALYGMSQVSDFRRAAYIDFRLSSRLIAHNRIIQPAYWAGYPDRNHPVNNYKGHYHQQHKHDDKIPDINHAVGKCGIGNHTDQLPAGIAYGIYNYRPALPFKGFLADAVPVFCSRRAVFARNPVAYLNLARMVDNLPVAVAQIIILPVI